MKNAKRLIRVNYPKHGLVGWLTRVTLQGTEYRKYFSDSVHGGYEEAKRKAFKWLLSQEKKLGLPHTKRCYQTKLRKSLPLGVRAKFSLDGKLVKFECYWNYRPNHTNRTSFSVKRHGEERALDLAISRRKEMEVRIYGKELPI